MRVIPEGDYPASIEKVVDTESKAGNHMQDVTFRVYGPEGREFLIHEYIVVPATVYKLQQIAIAIGREEDFDSGVFQVDDHIGENLTVRLKIEKSPKYPDQNKIAAYKPKTTGRAHRNAPPATNGSAHGRDERPAFAPPGNADNEIPF